MTHAALKQVLGRVEVAKQDADFTYFFALLLAGEALAKTIVLGMLAAVVDDRDRNHYRLEHSLVRSDGMGDWGAAIEDALTGPASQYLLADARREQTELTKLCRPGDWQHAAVTSLKATLDAIGIESEGVPVKTDMKRWFRLFATLRNGTRAHGATLPATASVAARHLECSIQSIVDSFCLFRRPWAYLYRNISGKYRVSEICDTGGMFDYLKKETRHSLPNGVYLFLGNAPRLVPLIQSDAELRDFYFANGKFNGKRFELLSYVTDDNLLTDAYIDQLVAQSEGHPYVIKVLLGEVANARTLVDIPRVIAGRDEILTALFERTYAALSPCAQRAFMTLAAWNSAVPRIALEAVMMRSVPERDQVESGIESLLRYSFVETYVAPQDKQEFLGLPLVTSLFGKRKLNVSPSRAAIQVDVEVLQMLGPSRRDDLHLGLANRLERFIGNIARRVDAGEALDDYVPMLEMICRAYSPGWLIVARWHMERGSQDDFERAKAASRRFLELDPAGPEAPEAWQMLGRACYQTRDALGEVHAFVERAQLGAVPYADVSNTANLLNRLLYEHELDVEKEEKQNFAHRLLAVMEKRRSEADADAYSRMAWLAIHVGQNAKAVEYASAGLDVEPDNPHCLRIAQRLGVA